MPKLVPSEKIASALLCTIFSVSAIPAFAADSASATSSATPATTESKASAAPTAATTEAPTISGTAPASPAVTDPAAVSQETAPKIMWKPGESLETSTDTEDIIATYDIELARRQVAAYSDSPEASFILAIALTRTSRVEEALKEVQRARKLAESKGGPAYFDKMIASYEKMLVSYPKDNQVRYGLAWAYYMKAYLLGRHSRKVAAWKAGAAAQAAAQANGTASGATGNATASGTSGKDIGKALSSGNLAGLAGSIASMVAAQGKPGELPHIPGALEKVDPADIPQITAYYDKALGQIAEILKTEPNDIWSIVYSAHLKAEYTGNLEGSMKVWRHVADTNPNNPAPFFFLGEGYLKQGNLKESINHVSKAIALRALGN